MGQQVGPNTWEFDVRGTKVRGQGATESEARQEFKARYNRAAVAPPPGVSTGTPEQHRDLDLVGKIKQALLGAPVTGTQLSEADVRTPGGFATVARGAAQVVTPSNNAEAAIMAVLPFAGRAASAVVGGARGAVAGTARAATRLAVPAAAGGAAGAVQGGSEGARAGALTGLTAAGVGEAFQGTGSLVEAAASRWGNLDTRAFQTRVRDVLGPELAQRVGQDIPSLKGKVPLGSVSDVLKLTDEQTGRKVLATMFDATEAKIGRVLKNQKFSIDEDIIRLSQGKPLRADVGQIVQMPGAPAQPGRPATPGAPGQPAVTILGPGGQPVVTKPAVPAQAAQPATPGTPATTVPVTVLDAQDVLGVAKRLRFMASQRDNPLSFPAKEKAEELLDQVLSTVQGFDPALATTYEGLRQDYRKFMKLRDFLSAAPQKLFPGLPTPGGATIDLVNFGDRLIQNFADVSPTDFPAVHDLFTGPGGGAGTRPIAGSLPAPVGRARIGVPIPGLEGVRAYEGGRFPTTVLPPHLQEQVGTPLPGKIAAVGQKIATGSAPLVGPAVTDASAGP